MFGAPLGIALRAYGPEPALDHFPDGGLFTNINMVASALSGFIGTGLK